MVARLLLVAILAFGLAGVLASPAEAAKPAVKFGKWQADYKGTKVSDLPITNTKLNGEYIVVVNTTGKAINLTGYRITDRYKKHSWTFPKNFVLKAHASVTIHTGKGKNTKKDLYMNQVVKGAKKPALRGYVWNNSGDTAQLRNKKGTVVHTCVYKKTKSGYRNC